MFDADMLGRWFKATIVDLLSDLRWSYAPPLMVYLAAGLQGMSAIVAAFFVKEYLSLSASFLAGLAFWASLPWALKIPVGHLVDIIWRWKGALVFLGAGLIALSLVIMYGLIAHTGVMRSIMAVETWYVVSILMAPVGYVIQDVVADAMTVEAVPTADDAGVPFSEEIMKAQHTTMQTLGRLAMFLGLFAVALLNITLFDGVGDFTPAQKADTYALFFLLELIVPVISICGVILNHFQVQRRRCNLLESGLDSAAIDTIIYAAHEETPPNWWIFGGTAVFAAFTLIVGLTQVPYAQEIIFAGSAVIIFFLMGRLLEELEPDKARMLVGTAAILFVFRATPLPGQGIIWFEIDVLKFDQQFLSVLSLLTALITLVGIVLVRPLVANRSIAYITVLLSIGAGIIALPGIALYYGLHNWTARWTGGVVDAHFIAFIDTALESPLDQVAMIPLLAWIARNAPNHLKATFFTVMASFVNLALSASNLLTKYVNALFVVTREVRDLETGLLQIPADYNLLGWLLISVGVISVVAPLMTVWFVQRTPYRTTE